MRILLMCEGKNEEVILNILLDNNMLKFTRDDLIGLKPYAVRQLNLPVLITELKHNASKVYVYRIGDKQSDKLSIPSELKNIVIKDNIFKFCTKPEFEILLIINEGLLKNYEKVKNKMSAKSFAKEYIKLNGKKYDQSTEFIKEYYGNDVNNLVNNIKEYKRYKKSHARDELYLVDILKDS